MPLWRADHRDGTIRGFMNHSKSHDAHAKEAPAQHPPTVEAKRCLVTGAAGFIGSHLSEALLAEGHTVLGIDAFIDYYSPEIKVANIATARAHPRYQFIEADLRSADLDPILEGVDVVFHLAAMAGLLKSWTDFDRYQSCNINATHRLIDAAQKAGISHFIHVSTSSVYGRDSSGSEDRPKAPTSPYGVTKLAAEHLVRAYAAKDDLPYTILRYFSIYGPRQRPDMGYHIFVRRILGGRPITIFGDGKQTRGNTFVHDCVAGTMAAMHAGPTQDTFNIGGGEVVSALDVIAKIEEITQRKAILEFGPSRPGEQQHALADTSKARERLGWQAATGIDAGLRAQIAWMIEDLGLDPEPSAELGSDKATNTGTTSDTA